MVRADSDTASQLLTVHFSERVVPEEMRQGVETIRTLLENMQPGFRMLTDLSELASMDPRCASHVGTIMDLCSGKGIKRVARVIPDPHKDIGFNLISLFHYGDDVEVATFQTLLAALESLAPEH